MANANLEDVSVLLFHESRDLSRHYVSVLRLCGLRNIITSTRISEAFSHIISTRIDIIFAVQVPGSPQFARLLEELSGHDATSDLPIVAVTKEGEVRNALRLIAMGAKELLTEPLSRLDVETLIRKVLAIEEEDARLSDGIASIRQLVEKNDLDNAGVLCRELLRDNPSNVDLFLELFNVNCLRKQWLEAEANLRKAMDLVKSKTNKIEVHRNLSRIFHSYGQLYEKRNLIDKAVKSYRTSLTLNPFCVESITSLLRLLQKRDEVDEMTGILKEAHSNFLPYSQPLEEIALCVRELAANYMSLNMDAQGKALYSQLALLEHENIDVHLAATDYMIESGQISAAIETMFRVVQRIKDVDLCFKLGDLLLDVQRRFMTGGKVVESKDMDLSFFLELGGADVVRMAMKALNEGMLVEPDNSKVRLALARCHLRLGDEALAGAAMEKAMGAGKDDADLVVDAIDLLMEEGAHTLASTWLKDASSRFPEEPRIFKLNADLCRVRNQHYDAVAWLKRGLSLKPDYSDFVVGLGDAYMELKHYSDAILYYERAKKLLPDSADIQQKLQTALAQKYKKA